TTGGTRIMSNGAGNYPYGTTMGTQTSGMTPEMEAKFLWLMDQARDIAKQAGLRYPYIGNVRGVKDSETTFCPKCGKTVVKRKGYRVQQVNIEKGACKSCDTPIAGVWTA
ncbi:MAG: hypothetical protein QGH94_17920, partial [Phycisphaerae bacterium]|nr:hypothetical protein [Phycisphaerae bacterium]